MTAVLQMKKQVNTTCVLLLEDYFLMQVRLKGLQQTSAWQEWTEAAIYHLSILIENIPVDFELSSNDTNNAVTLTYWHEYGLERIVYLM